MIDAAAERRRYFRIDDHVRLRYEVIRSLRHLPGHEPSRDGAPERVLLDELESEFNSSLNTLWRENPVAARALAQLNRKLDLISSGEKLGGVGVTALVTEPTPVNISGCGIAFEVTETLKRGQLLDLHLTLLPSETNLRLVARIVDLEPLRKNQGDERYLLRAEFADQESRQQDTLISHIVQRQHALRSAGDG